MPRYSWGVDPLAAGVLVAETDVAVAGFGGVDEADGVVAVDVKSGDRDQPEWVEWAQAGFFVKLAARAAFRRLAGVEQTARRLQKPIKTPAARFRILPSRSR